MPEKTEDNRKQQKTTENKYRGAIIFLRRQLRRQLTNV